MSRATASDDNHVSGLDVRHWCLRKIDIRSSLLNSVT
jgi:hypothetical protein